MGGVENFKRNVAAFQGIEPCPWKSFQIQECIVGLPGEGDG
jgi:hypothetical protein